jgi:translation initiation factor IF-1
MNEILVYKKIIGCVDVNRTNTLGNYLFKVKCKWEHKVKGGVSNAPHADV